MAYKKIEFSWIEWIVTILILVAVILLFLRMFGVING